MSFKTEQEAMKAATEVKATMKIGEWEIKVWNNLGWHCSLHWQYFGLSIHNYSALNNTKRFMLLVGHGGSGISSLKSYHGNDPNELIDEAIPKSIEQLKYYTDVAQWLNTQQRASYPKEITIDEHGRHVASFAYYTGIKYCKEKGILQNTRTVNPHDGYIVCCGDVLTVINETEFPHIKRETL